MDALKNLDYESVSLIVCALFVLMLLIIIIYCIVKEKEWTKKIHQLEHSIEDANKEIYKIQKWILQKEKNEEKKDDKNISLESLDSKTNNILDSLNAMKNDVNSIQYGLQSDREYFEEKIMFLEEKLREFRHFSAQGTNVNEKHIIDMFSENKSIDSIAKELRISRGEVEFVLRLAELKGNK